MADETKLLRHNEQEEEEEEVEQEDGDLKKPSLVIIQEPEHQSKSGSGSPVDEPAAEPPSPQKSPSPGPQKSPSPPKKESTPIITVDEPSTRFETTESTEEVISGEHAPLIQVRIHEEVREERVVKFAASPAAAAASPQEKEAAKKNEKKKGFFGKSKPTEEKTEKIKVEETKKKERSVSPLKKDADIRLGEIPRTISETKIPRNLFVMTLNTWGMGKNVSKGFEKLVNHIRIVDPDILALQEVTSKREFNKLLQALGPDWIGYCR